MRAVCVGLFVFSVAACHTNRMRGRNPGDAGAQIVTDAGTHIVGDGGIVITTGDGMVHVDAGACIACSSDLHNVLDCSGNVIATCGATEGCSPTRGCIAACDAAAANRTSVGCEYYAPTPPKYFQGGTCYAAFIANTWGQAVTLGVDRAGVTLNVDAFGAIPAGAGQSITYTPLVSGALPPNAVAILFLDASGMPCPANHPTATSNAQFAGTDIGDAFHITASAPVVAYDIYPYGGGSSAIASASLLQPTSAWDTSYIAVTVPETYLSTDTDPPDGAAPWIGFVSQMDGTRITIRPSVGVVGGVSVQGGPANMPITYTLDKGRFLKIAQDAELSGTIVSSDHPIAVFGGIPATQLPKGQVAADSMHQQIPPAHALGNRYAAVRYRNRVVADPPESPPWTIVGLVNGTQLTYDPPVATGPTSVDAAAVLRFNATGPFVVHSQDAAHPFYFAQHMTGWQVASPESSPGIEGPNGSPGDPEWVNVVPPAQYLSHYVFFTDPTYPTTDLVFVRQRVKGAFADVTLDCAGTLTGWKPVDSSDDLEYVTFDLIDGNFVKNGTCDNGHHIADSTTPFGLTVWGWGTQATGYLNEMGNVVGYYSEAVSYAYPAGQNLQFINSVPIPPVQ